MSQIFNQAPDPAAKDKAVSELRRSKKASADMLASAAVPRDRDDDWAAYYAATDAKHFGDPTLPGSKFLNRSLKKFEDVVALAAYQRGNLDGDYRDKFIELGATSDAFKDGNRYLFVKTEGTVGILNSAGLPDDAQVQVVRTKPGYHAPLFMM